MDVMSIFEEFVGISEAAESRDDMEYGLPHLKKYPLYDKKHVLAAIKFFNYCEDLDDQKILAKAIIKKMKKYGIGPDSVGEDNKLKKFVEKSSLLNESVDMSQKSPSLFYFEKRLKPGIKSDILDAFNNWSSSKRELCKLEELFILNPGDDVEVQELLLRATISGNKIASGEEFRRHIKQELPMHFYVYDIDSEPTDGYTPEYNIMTGEWIR